MPLKIVYKSGYCVCDNKNKPLTKKVSTLTKCV